VSSRQDATSPSPSWDTVGLVGAPQDAFQLGVGGGLEGRVDLGGGGGLRCRGGAGAELARRLYDDVDAEVAPGQIFGVGMLQDPDRVAIDVEQAAGGINGAGPGAVGRVVLQ
jgi:hypothetical protein